MHTAHLTTLALNPALSLLPARMDSREARVLLIAIALQESRLEHREQIRGPARGWWQFEKNGGTRGVLHHDASRPYALTVCQALTYAPEADIIYPALQHNDVLAACFARLLLWTLPQALPLTADGAWNQYLEAWRPGRPHPATWPRLYAQAREAVQ